MASIVPDEVGSALRSTVGDPEGGAPRMGARAAPPVVAGWRRPEETGHPELLPVAGALSELGPRLSGGARDPAAVGAPLGTPSAQARGAAGSGLGAGVSGELPRLSALLAAQGRVLVALAS